MAVFIDSNWKQDELAVVVIPGRCFVDLPNPRASPLLRPLSFGQTIATCQRKWYGNMLRAFCHPVATCLDMLQHVGCCWLKFENGQIFHATLVDVAWCCIRLAKFVQRCCAKACALLRFATPNMSPHDTTGWPQAYNMLRPTMLRYAVLKCCHRVAGA